jgi:solute carrier family 25 phosphate transporter 3
VRAEGNLFIERFSSGPKKKNSTFNLQGFFTLPPPKTQLSLVCLSFPRAKELSPLILFPFSACDPPGLSIGCIFIKFTMASPAQSTGSTKVDAIVQQASAAAPDKLSGVALYSRFALAGAVCCSVTHGALTPVDVYVEPPSRNCPCILLLPRLFPPDAPASPGTVEPMLIDRSVKTRIQLDPAKYNNGMIGGFRKVIQSEGAGALLTGVGPTFAGYFLQGAFKFGGYEFFKQQAINQLGYENASNYRTAVYLASSAAAEFFADIALCPLEATRIRLVSEPTYASGLVSGFSKMLSTEGIGAFYAGFGPILFKQ